MELTKNHRSALLEELNKATHDIDIQRACLKKEEQGREIAKGCFEKPEKRGDLADWFEISIFLAEERIKLIKKAIEDNDIDW